MTLIPRPIKLVMLLVLAIYVTVAYVSISDTSFGTLYFEPFDRELTACLAETGLSDTEVTSIVNDTILSFGDCIVERIWGKDDSVSLYYADELVLFMYYYEIGEKPLSITNFTHKAWLEMMQPDIAACRESALSQVTELNKDPNAD